MGLDIYLYKSTNYKKHQEYIKHSEELDEIGEAQWPEGKEYSELTEKERDIYSDLSTQARLKRAKELGLKVNEKAKYSWDTIQDGYEEEVIQDSTKYPEHLFKIGHIRSSYNPSGINRFLQVRLDYDLYEIFEYGKEEDDEFKPNWKNVKKNTQKAIDDLNAWIKEDGAYDVIEIRTNEFKMTDILRGEGVPTESKAALDKFLTTKKQQEDQGSAGSFSNGEGEYFLKEPLEVVAIIAGANKRFFVDEFLPAQYVIYKIEQGSIDWYIHALEIMIEMCDYVLADEDKNNTYYLHWSG